MPEGVFLGDRVEAEDLFDAAVAVGRDDQDRSRKASVVLNPEKQVVVKLAPLPVIEHLVAAEISPQVGEQSAKPEVLRDRLHTHVVDLVRFRSGKIPPWSCLGGCRDR
jgi:hypothetical protein